MKPIVVIPARGGSKGIPNKNIKELGGIPLIKYSIDTALELFEEHQIIVSTDDNEIREVVKNSGLEVPFLRPKELATDTSGTYEVLLHALEYTEKTGYFPDLLILLQPTSPFRNANHIQEALTLYDESLEMVVSVKETKSNPYYLLFEEASNGYLIKSKKGDFNRRQDCPNVWEYNGAIYIINVEALKKRPVSQFEKVVKYVMDEISSHDIDTEIDWELAKCLLKERENEDF